jgi:predicted acyltransferase
MRLMTDPAPASPLSGRLQSLDLFRGATIAAMILVNNPGDWNYVYWPLLHVAWHGWTPTDLIFPFFLFIVGVSLTLSKRIGFRPALVRALKLVGLGLFLNLYPYFGFTELRWPGVLQRIGICYLAAWAARRWLRPRGQAVLAACLLVGYRRTSRRSSTASCSCRTSGATRRRGTPKGSSPPCRRSRRRSSACSSGSG